MADEFETDLAPLADGPTAPSPASSERPSEDQAGDKLAAEEDARLGALYDKMTADGLDEEAAPEARARGADGKFAKTSDDARDTGAEEDGAADPAATSTVADGPVAPAYLPQELKDAWGKIPADARGVVAAYVEGRERKFGEIGGQLRQYQTLGKQIEEVKAGWPQYFEGVDLDTMARGVGGLAIVQGRLERGTLNEKVQTFLEIGKQYGVLGHVAALMQNQPIAEGADDINSLRNELAQARAQIAQLSDETKFNERVEQKISTVRENAETEALVKTTAASLPLYAEVEADLPGFIRAVLETQPGADKATILRTAYELAVQARPETRAKAAAAAKAAAGNPEKQEAARRASSINATSRANGKDRILTEDEHLGAIWDAAQTH